MVKGPPRAGDTAIVIDDQQSRARGLWEGLGGLVRRRATTVLAASVTVVVLLGVAGTLVKFETSQDALIGGKSRVAQESHRYQDAFGGGSMLTVYGGDIEHLFTSQNVARMDALEGDLHRSNLYKFVLSPLTAMRFAQAELGVGTQIFAEAKATDPANAAKYDAILNGEFKRIGQVQGAQTLDNPSFVRFLLYDEHGKIRSALKTTFIDRQHALMIVRLKGNDPIDRMGKAADTAKQLVAKHRLDGFTTLTTGPPVLLQEINDYLQHGIVTLGGLAVLVMIALLFFVFRVRSRLLSLGCVIASTVCTFGIMGLVGLPLNLVTIAGLPILIGMGVDFAIQMHSRFEEELEHDHEPGAAAARVVTRLAPALALAMVAAGLGFLAMQISKVPMIRQFGAMLVLGVVMIFAVVLFVPLAFLVVREQRRPTGVRHGGGRVAAPRQGVLLERAVRRLALVGQARVVPIMLIGAVVVAAGFAVEGRFTIQTDPERWIPPNGSTEHSLQQLRSQAGFSSEVDFIVEAPNVLADPVAAWMDGYARQQMVKHSREFVQYASLGGVVSSVTQGTPTEKQLRLIYSIAPPDIKTAFVTPDFKQANLLFPITNITLHQRDVLLTQMKRDVHPPSGAAAIPSGLVVVGVALVKALQANRTGMTLTALGLVALLLLLYYRRVVQTLLTLVPVLVAVGLSSVVVFATGLELSPLTSVAGPLVIAVGTEFAVLIMSRYVEERERGRSREDAVDVGIVRIGRAFVASGLTLVGGFAVIALSAFPLLRDFGIIVALNTLVALIVALVVLPPLLVWADRHPRIGGFSPGIDLDHRAEHEASRELPVPPAPRTMARRRFTARR
jgi:hydrophobe/amphiphile efflux-3 (HAE3) family protein